MLKKDLIEKTGIYHILHSRETWHSSQYDFLDLHLKVCISPRPGCGKNVSKWIPQVIKYQDIESEVEEQMEKYIKKNSSFRL